MLMFREHELQEIKFEEWRRGFRLGLLLGASLTALVVVLFYPREAEAEASIIVAAPFLSDEFADGYAIMINERIARKWDVGLGFVSEQTVLPQWEADRDLPPVELERNAFVYIRRVYNLGHLWEPLGRAEFSLGIAGYQNLNRALSKHFNASVNLGYWLTRRIRIFIEHNSNMGTDTPNLGQDYAGIGYGPGRRRNAQANRNSIVDAHGLAFNGSAVNRPEPNAGQWPQSERYTAYCEARKQAAATAGPATGTIPNLDC